MRARRAITLAVFGAITAAAAIVVAGRFQVTVDVTRFLVDAAERDLGEVAFALTDSPPARTLVLALSAPDLATAIAAADAWQGELARHPEVAELRAGPDPAWTQAVFELYFPRRLLFLSPSPERDIPALFSPEGLRSAARRLREALAAPGGALVKPLAGEDPLLAFATQLGRMEAAQAWSLRARDGHFVAGDPPRAILLLTTAHSAFDSQAQAPLLDFVAQSFAALDRRFGGVLELSQSGAHRFAVDSERRARTDAAWLSAISLVLLVAAFAWIYRSTSVLLLCLAPLALGMLVATAATLMCFGSLHALTLAFGATLIGICTDYPLHLLTHCALRPPGSGLRAVVRRLRSPLALAAGTTLTGFLVLASADLPGIREVGVFAMIGVGAAVIATLFLLPELIPDRIGPTPQLQVLTAWLGRLTLARPARRPIALATALAAALVCLAGLPQIRWDEDVFALNVSLRSEWVQEDEALRKLVTAPETQRWVVAIGSDDASALALDAAVAERLRAAQAAGSIQGFRSVAALVWPAPLQQRNWRALAAESDAAGRLADAFEAEGFRPGVFAEFERALAAGSPSPLTLADVLASPLRVAVAPYRVELEDGRIALLSAPWGVQDVAALRGALEGLSGAQLFDAKGFAAGIYARYRARSIEAVALGSLAVLLLLAARYRRVRLVWVAAAPALLAGAVTLALLALAGVPVSLLHLLGVLLVLCLGVDYGIFLVEARLEGGDRDAVSRLSVVVDCLTTLLSFGLLAGSSFPALSALGVSTSLGVCLSLWFVLCFDAVLPARAGDRGGIA